MKTFIIILHYGDSKVTKKCLESLLKHEKEFEEIVIVDNDINNKFSIKSQFLKRKITIIKNNKNLGYAGGMNIGIKYALEEEAAHVLLLNNDIQLEEPILQELLNVLTSNKQIGVVSPAIKFYRNGSIIYDCGGNLNIIFGRTSHDESKIIINKTPHPVDYVSGCCMLIKKEVFEKIGLLDEDFFLYYEDVDFCHRAKKTGFLTYVLPKLQIFHSLSRAIGKNSSLATYYQTKSALIFGKKHIRKTRIFNLLFIFFQSINIMLKKPTNGISAFKAMFEL